MSSPKTTIGNGSEQGVLNVKMRAIVALAALVILPATARAENSTIGVAKNILVGSISVDALGAAPADNNWFRYSTVAGRSYCVEVDNGELETSVRDTQVDVIASDTTSPIGSNDDVADEPAASLLSRFCYISPGGDNYANVSDGTVGGAAGTFRIRVIDTTLFCPWFFVGNGYESFILVKNTTTASHTATVSLLDPSGAALGTPQTGTLVGNGSFNLAVSQNSPIGFGLASGNGGVTIAHDGPPGAMIANVTSLNFGLGISFDTPASPRQDYR